MVYDVYLRRGKETIHMLRYRGSPDPERANRMFQEMIEEPLYAAAMGDWDTLALFPASRPNEVGRKFPRSKRPEPPERWFS